MSLEVKNYKCDLIVFKDMIKAISDEMNFHKKEV